MANPLTLMPEFGIGNMMWKPVLLPGPASYATGGSTISASTFGLSNLILTFLCGAQDSSGTYWAQLRQANGPGATTFTMQVYAVGGFTEVSANTDLSSYVWRVVGAGN